MQKGLNIMDLPGRPLFCCTLHIHIFRAGTNLLSIREWIPKVRVIGVK